MFLWKEHLLKWKEYRIKVLAIIAILVVLLFSFLFFFCITPKSSVIYYEGSSELSRFEVSEVQVFQLRISDDQYNGRISFRADPEQTIYAVNQGLLLDIQWEDLDWEPYEDSQVFLFDEGSATLGSPNYLELTIQMPDDSPFSYSLEIKNESTDEGEVKKNLVSITNLPEEAKVILRSDAAIDMKGNVTGNEMQAGAYEIFCCNSISFFLCPPASDNVASGDEREYSLSAPVSSFQIKNSGRQVLEFTVDGQTEFKEIGHIELNGDAEKTGSLTVGISDLGAYPVPVTLSGGVGRLELAGQSLYLTIGRWLRSNMTQILLALMGVIFSALIVIPSKK